MMCRRYLGLSLFIAALAFPGEALAGWGEHWGTMVWSAAPTPVPTLGLLGFGLLSLALAAGAVFSLRRRAWTMSVLLVALAVPLTVGAIDVLVPHTFSNGSVANAEEVTANFTAAVSGGYAESKGSTLAHTLETAPLTLVAWRAPLNPCGI